MKFIDRLKLLGFENYSGYLKCDHWLNFKKLYFETHIKSCINCHSTRKISLHHLRYDNLGAEKQEDVIAICQFCHFRAHRLIKEKKLHLYEAHLYLGAEPITTKLNLDNKKSITIQKHHKSKKQKKIDRRIKRIKKNKHKNEKESHLVLDALKNKNSLIYTDGFLFGSNPSTIGGGYTLISGDNKFIEKTDILKSNITYNDVELLGLQQAIKISQKNGYILTDSQTAQGWVNKGKSKGRPDLNEILKWCKEKITQNNIKILFTPRKKNLAGLYNEQFVKK